MGVGEPSAKNEINPNINFEDFANELSLFRKEIEANLNFSDFKHLKKIELWGKLCSISGYATAWILPNLFSAFLISQGNFTRWTMLAHHITHRGYDKIPNIPKRYTSRLFAKGLRRFKDWFDWILPEPWDLEHNKFHHYFTGEISDPDLVEQNTKIVRDLKIPKQFKLIAVLFFMLTWKFSYYAPNTLWIQQEVRRRKKKGQKVKLSEIMKDNQFWTYHGVKVLLPLTKSGIEFWSRCVLPYCFFRFGLLPSLFLPLGLPAVFNVWMNSILAEFITNIHTFIAIVPNHAGEDLYRFEKPVSGKVEYYVRQVIGSVNYTGGGKLANFLQGYLNFQIEHHLWPDLPMSKYEEIQPKIKQICEKYKIPYRQENIFKRLKKMTDIMIGKKSMKII